MQRVVLIAAFIGGLLLMSLTSGLLMQRRGTAPPQIVLLAVQPPIQTSYRLTWVLSHDGREIWKRLPQESGVLNTLGTSPDGKWLYVQVYEPLPNGYDLSTQRIRLDGLVSEPLPTVLPTSSIHWSPDGQWMVYRAVGRYTGQEELFIASADGQFVENLTSGFGKTFSVDGALAHIISPTHDWIVFNAYDGTNQVYRVDMTDGAITQLTDAENSAYVQGYFHNDSGDWLCIKLMNRYYRMRLDGSDMTPLLPFEYSTDFDLLLWREARLILIEITTPELGLYAISMDDFSVRWSLPNMVLVPAPVGQSYVLGFGAEGAVYAIDRDGQAQQVAPLFANMPDYQLSPDERWLAYTMGTHLYAVTLPDGQERPLFNGRGTLNMLEWAEDGESVILQDASNGFSLWRVWLDDGHKQRLLAYQEDGQYLGMGRLDDESVDGFILMDMGGVLFASAIVRLVRRKKS